MNNLKSLFPPNYKNLEQKDAVKLLEEIEKVVEGMDRFTAEQCSKFLKCYTPCGDNGLCNRCDRLIDAISKLAELKTKLENGMLVELPCKVGDKVKVLCDGWGNVWNYKTIDYGKFLVGEIISITITKKQVLMKIQAEHNVEWKRERRRYPISALGKTVFLTLADAENKLNEGVE